MNKTGEIGGWPTFEGIPMRRPYTRPRGIEYIISTHWQYGLAVTVFRKGAAEKSVADAIAQAIKGLGGCAHTADNHGLRAYALRQLRKGKAAIVPHPSDLKKEVPE